MAGSRNDPEAIAAGNPSDSAAELSTRIDIVIGALSGVCSEEPVSGLGGASLSSAPPALSESAGLFALSAAGKEPSAVESVMAWEDSTGAVSLGAGFPRIPVWNIATSESATHASDSAPRSTPVVLLSGLLSFTLAPFTSAGDEEGNGHRYASK